MNFKTYVNPASTRVPPVDKARNLFINELCVDIDDKTPGLSLKINTFGENDHIKIDDRHIFSKKFFISTKMFRNKLEEYYNKHGIYIGKPYYVDHICFLNLERYTNHF